MKNILKHSHFCTIILLALVFAATLAMTAFSPMAIASATDFAYNSTPEISYGPVTGEPTRGYETFTYDFYVEEIYYINNSIPQYYNVNASLTGACCPVAGANVLGYYDRTYTNLIPNFSPGVLSGNNYYYYSMSTVSGTISPLISTLYTAMSTNPNSGTTQANFEAGLTNYVTGCGQTMTFSSAMYSGSLNYNVVVPQMASGKPITLFVSNYYMVSASIGATTAIYNTTYYSGNHAMVAFGYRRLRYFKNSAMIRCDIMLYCSTGSSSGQTGWYLNKPGSSCMQEADVSYIH